MNEAPQNTRSRQRLTRGETEPVVVRSMGDGDVAQIVGRVKELDGRGLAATIELLHRADGTVHRVATTASEDGRFSVAAPGAGPWVVAASVTGYRDARLEFHSLPAGSVTVTLTRTIAVELRVLDETGAPVPGIPIVARWGDDARGARGLETDVEGRALLADCVAEGDRVHFACGRVVHGRVPSIEGVVRNGRSALVLVIPSHRTLRVLVDLSNLPNEIFALEVCDGLSQGVRVPWTGGVDSTFDVPSSATRVRVFTAAGPSEWVPADATVSTVHVTTPATDLRAVTVEGDGRDWAILVSDRAMGGPPYGIPFSASTGRTQKLLVRNGLSYTFVPIDTEAAGSVSRVVDTDSPSFVSLTESGLVPFVILVSDPDGRPVSGATVVAVISPSNAQTPATNAVTRAGMSRMELSEHAVYRISARLDGVGSASVRVRVERGGEVAVTLGTDVRLTMKVGWLGVHARAQCGVLPGGREAPMRRDGDDLTVDAPIHSWLLARIGGRFFIIDGGGASRSLTIPDESRRRTIVLGDGRLPDLRGMLFVVAKDELTPGVRAAWLGGVSDGSAVVDLAPGDYRCVLRTSDMVRVLGDLRVDDAERIELGRPPAEGPEVHADSGHVAMILGSTDGAPSIPLFTIEQARTRLWLAPGVELRE